MKTGALAMFVKTPGLSPIKTRLAVGVGKDKAENIYRRMLRMTESLAKIAETSLPIAPYWAVAEQEAMDHSLWKSFPRVSQGTGTLGERLSRVFSELMNQHSFVFMIGADCPDLDRSTLEEAIRELNSNDFVIGRTEDGGFYLLGSRKKISRQTWTSVPYSTEQTADKLVDQLKRLGTVSELRILTDIDTAEDLAKAAASLI